MKEPSKQKKSKAKSPPQTSNSGEKLNFTADKPVIFNDPSQFLKNYKTLTVKELIETAREINSKYIENDVGFSLRKFCPEASNYLKQHYQVPHYQRRVLGPILQIRTQRIIDVKNDQEFFDAILDVLEHTPSFLMLLTLSVAHEISNNTTAIDKLVEHYAKEFSLIQLVKDSRKNLEDIETKFKKNGEKSLFTTEIIGLFLLYCFNLGISSTQDTFRCKKESDFGGEISEDKKREFKLPELPLKQISGTENEKLVISERLIVLAKRLMGSYNQNDFEELQETIEQLNAWQNATGKKVENTATK